MGEIKGFTQKRIMTKNEEEVKNSVFGFGAYNEAYAKYFQGKSFLNPLASSEEAQTGVSNVSFEPGYRNDWHCTQFLKS